MCHAGPVRSAPLFFLVWTDRTHYPAAPASTKAPGVHLRTHGACRTIQGGRMGFKEVQALLIEALRAGLYKAEDRSDVREKNLLYTREVTPAFVIHLLSRCAGWEYSTSRHH